jgi:pimeloyl-ACP methyl ester carboxylesterase
MLQRSSYTLFYFPENAMQNQNYSQTRLPMPVLALGAGYIPAFGGISNPTAVLGKQQLAENVQGIMVPNSGHFIAEEQPQFVINQLSNFFGNSTNGTGDTGDTGGIFFE